MLRPFAITCSIFLLAVACNSCKKTTEDQLINGLWALESVYVDTSTANYMNKFPEFANGNGCCFYKINFDEANIVLSYYLTHDSVRTVATGTWIVNSYSQVYIKLDNFMDGTFNIDRVAPKHWELTSKANHIAAFDSINPTMDTTYTKLELYKI